MTSFASQIDLFHEQAASFAGYDDFGDPDEYRSNLACMLEFADTEVDWTDLGRQMFPQRIVGSLCSRLYAQRGFAQFPDCLQQPIRKPIIIEGFRSGTSLFHQMLASLPDTQSLPMWLTSFPMPRPPRNTWQEYPEFKMVSAGLEAMNDMLPGLLQLHPMFADEAEENHWCDQTYATLRQMGYMWTADYISWVSRQSPEKYFKRFEKILQLIGYQNPGKWVLKCPLQMGWAEQTQQQFPDATLVHTYRDPSESIVSLINLTYLAISHIQCADKKAFGRNLGEILATALDRYVDSRSKRKSAMYLDIEYKEVVSDPVGCARKVFMHNVGDFSEANAKQIADWFAGNRKHQKVKPDYLPEDYGLSTEWLRERTAKYIDYFRL